MSFLSANATGAPPIWVKGEEEQGYVDDEVFSLFNYRYLLFAFNLQGKYLRLDQVALVVREDIAREELIVSICLLKFTGRCLWWLQI